MVAIVTYPTVFPTLLHAPAFADRLFAGARRCWYSMRRIWWAGYFQIRVEGLQNVPTAGGVLLCGNHTSHLDAPALLAALPRGLALRASTAAAKDVFGDHPWRNALSKLATGSIAIQRQAEFAKGLRALEAVLVEGRPLVLFPEGRRGTGDGLLPFKPGAAMLSLRTGALVVPVWLDGLDKAMPKGAKLPAATEVMVRFGKPIDPAPLVRAIAAGTLSRRQAYADLTEMLRAAVERMGRNEPGANVAH